MQILVFPASCVIFVSDNEVLQPLPISVGVVKDTASWLAVSAGTTALLSVVFQAFRESSVNHKSYILFVDAHSKGNRSYDNVDLIPHPPQLHFFPGSVVHFGVVIITFNFVFAQLSTHFFALLPR